MLQAFREGGWGMFPTLLFGLVTLGAALRFAFRVDPKLRGFIASMTRATLFFGLSGFVTGLIATGSYIEKNNVVGSDVALTLIMGIKESTNNLALAFTLISLVQLIVAVGRRRLDARLTAGS